MSGFEDAPSCASGERWMRGVVAAKATEAFRKDLRVLSGGFITKPICDHDGLCLPQIAQVLFQRLQLFFQLTGLVTGLLDHIQIGAADEVWV